MRRSSGLSVVRSSFIALAIIGCSLDSEPGPTLPPADRVAWRVRGHTGPNLPSFDSTSAFFATKDHMVAAIDKLTGATRWTSPTGSGLQGDNALAGTIVAGDVVVVGDGNSYAFDRATGTPVWSYTADFADATGQNLYATDGATIFTATLLGRVYALDSHTGVPKWITHIPGPDTAHVFAYHAVVGGGQVFTCLSFGGNPVTGGVAALDGATGHVLWVHDFAPRLPDLPSSCTNSPVLVAGLVVASSDDGRIYGLDTATGAQRWFVPAVPRFAGGDSRALAVSKNVVVATSSSGYATGIDAVTGATRWQMLTARDESSLGVYVAADSLIAIFTTGDSELLALDPQTGEEKWRTGAGDTGGDFWWYASIDAGRVYANGFEAFYALKTR
jgi:outer membrane protein assembly factor BamB